MSNTNLPRASKQDITESDMQQAVFLIGCLVAEGFIAYRTDERLAYGELEAAIRMTAFLLANIRKAGDDMPGLPFDW